MPEKDELYNVTISDINSDGYGICRIGGVVTFVIGGVTGDECEIKIIKVLKNYCVAAVSKLMSPSPYRTAPSCDNKRCGGCVFCNITDEYELTVKKKTVEGAFLRAGIDLPVAETAFAGKTYGYRNKAQFPVGTDKNGHLFFGYYAKRSHEIIKCQTCSIAHPDFTAIAETVCRTAEKYGIPAYDESSGKGLLRHICMRYGKSGILLTLVINAVTLPDLDRIIDETVSAHKNLTGVMINVNRKNTNVIYGEEFRCVYGSDMTEDELCGLTFDIASPSFYQVNHDCCEALYRKAGELLDLHGGETVVDLYCGVGTVGMCAASGAGRLVGIEIVPEAVRNAEKNARKNGFENAEFHCGDSSMIKKIISGRVDVLIVDPPRKGLSDEVIEAIFDVRPDKLLYISCDPNTLARDLKKLLTVYGTDKAYPFNMFPKTSHVETVCLLSRQ